MLILKSKKNHFFIGRPKRLNLCLVFCYQDDKIADTQQQQQHPTTTTTTATAKVSFFCKQISSQGVTLIHAKGPKNNGTLFKHASKLVSYKLVSYKRVSYKRVRYKRVSYKLVSYKFMSFSYVLVKKM